MTRIHERGRAFALACEKIGNMNLRPLVLVCALALAASACGGDRGDATSADGTSSSAPASTFAAQVASSDLAAGSPEPVQIGVFSSSDEAGVRLLTFGTVDVAFSFLGEDGSEAATSGPTAIATYVPAPTTPDGGSEPRLTDPAQARGVYVTPPVELPGAGVWRATVTATVDGEPVELDASFPVYPEHRIPAPGDRAPRTKNLTIHTKGVPPVAIDSRAQDGAQVPDPDFHDATIAETVGSGTPAVVLFATPAYCQSMFCGPMVRALDELAAEFGDRVEFIHVEIWRDHGSSTVNRAAAEWLLRDGDLTEPWLYVIDGDGVIVDRWGPLFDQGEVRRSIDGVIE